MGNIDLMVQGYMVDTVNFGQSSVTGLVLSLVLVVLVLVSVVLVSEVGRRWATINEIMGNLKKGGTTKPKPPSSSREVGDFHLQMHVQPQS